MTAALVESLARYLQGLQHLSENTQKAYKRDLEHFYAFCETRELKAWNAVDGRQIQYYVAQRHRQGMNGRSLQRQLSAIRAFFQFLIETGESKINPAKGIRAPKSERRLPKTLDVDESQQLVEIEETDTLSIRDRAILELVYSSGLRLSELTSLNLDNIDQHDASVTVTGKGNKTRIVPVGRKALEALRAWLKLRASVAKEDETALFVSQRGTRISGRNIQQRLKQWAIKQGINKNLHPHMLRHAFASHMLESSGDLRAVQELLGHSDISTTQIYTHLDFQHLAKAYDEAHPRSKMK